MIIGKSRRKSQQNIFENFDIEQYIGKELVDKFTLWALIVLTNLIGITEFKSTPNLMNNFEKVSFRRFDSKIKLGFLDSEKSWSLFKIVIKKIFNPIEGVNDFIQRLRSEVEVKMFIL